jgi:hypothetical protein
MRFTYAIHIIAGSLSLLVGYIALYSVKGATLHRKAGIVFVYTMLVMSLFGATIAIVRDVAMAVNLPAASMTAYLVITSLTTVRAPTWWPRWADVGLMLFALVVAGFALTFAAEAIANGGSRNGMPAFPFVMFGIVAVLGTIGDFRVLRSGALRGAQRLARHLWRMSFALFIAALSFFIGQAKVIPKPIRIYPLLAMPVLAVLVTMFYWLWRVRIKRSLKGIVNRAAVDGARRDDSATPSMPRVAGSYTS